MRDCFQERESRSPSLPPRLEQEQPCVRHRRAAASCLAVGKLGRGRTDLCPSPETSTGVFSTDVLAAGGEAGAVRSAAPFSRELCSPQGNSAQHPSWLGNGEYLVQAAFACPCSDPSCLRVTQGTHNSRLAQGPHLVPPSWLDVHSRRSSWNRSRDK